MVIVSTHRANSVLYVGLVMFSLSASKPPPRLTPDLSHYRPFEAALHFSDLGVNQELGLE
jgi:hypothetical protein